MWLGQVDRWRGGGDITAFPIPFPLPSRRACLACLQWCHAALPFPHHAPSPPTPKPLTLPLLVCWFSCPYHYPAFLLVGLANLTCHHLPDVCSSHLLPPTHPDMACAWDRDTFGTGSAGVLAAAAQWRRDTAANHPLPHGWTGQTDRRCLLGTYHLHTALRWWADLSQLKFLLLYHLIPLPACPALDGGTFSSPSCHPPLHVALAQRRVSRSRSSCLQRCSSARTPHTQRAFTTPTPTPPPAVV